MLSVDLKTRLDAVASAGGFERKDVERFASFLSSAQEEELFRMSPLRYASQAGMEQGGGIDLFLHAAHAGILEFSWGVLCPACASFITTPGGLKSLTEQRRCNFCQIDVPAWLDDGVEVAFTVSPAVRRIRFHAPESLDMRKDGAAVFFSPSLPTGGGFRKLLGEGVIWAGRAERGQVLEASADFGPGRYVLLAPASHSVIHIDASEGGPGSVEAEILDGRAIPDRVRAGTGRAALRVRNRTGRSAEALLFADPVPPPELRRPECRPPASALLPFLTGKRLITSQAFRDLFRAQSIPSEGGLELKSLTLLFTDLTRSTEMYERIGDLQAFGLVRKHFALLRDIVAAEGGAVVKTIGDAIMASFAEPPPAMRAAVEMNRGISRVSPDLALKIGIHSGPCIAVDLNDRLDYFGRTVNLAARVQGLAGMREIVCTEAFWRSPGVEGACGESGHGSCREEAVLKGIPGATPVVRIKSA